MSALSVAQSAPLAIVNGASVYHRDWRALLGVVPTCDALIVDAPYSARTHRGHNAARSAGVPYLRADGAKATDSGTKRRKIAYGAWTAEDVAAFVEAWHPRTLGWFVSLTDHVLAPAWEAALRSFGRYTFAPFPYVAPGSRVRMTGDGPTNWAVQIVVARPQRAPFSRWGALPGAYVLPAGASEEMPVVGGKPSWLAQRLVEDYSRPGDLVCDPCCGAGTTLVGAIRAGRRAVGGDALRAHAQLAATWIANPYLRAPRGEREDERQPSLFGRAI